MTLSKSAPRSYLYLDAEIQAVATWIEYVIEKPFLTPSKTLQQSLKDGTILCQLIAALKPIKFPQYQKEPNGLAFKEMENIAYFMQNSKEFGVKCDWTFGDLRGGRSIGAVSVTITKSTTSCD